MKKNAYRKKITEIETLESTIETNRGRQFEARQRLASAEKDLDKNRELFGKALISADPKKISTLEEEISTLEKSILQRDNFFLEALAAEEEELIETLEKIKDEAGKIFAKNAAVILERLVGEFDLHAREAIRSKKRLIAVNNLLRESGFSHVFREAIGPAVDVLGSCKIPLLRDFTLSRYNGGTQVNVGNVVDELREAIETL